MAALIELGRTLWDYLKRGQSLSQSDLLALCCSYDLRFGDYAADLLKSGVAGRVVITGKSGNWTRDLWSETEAQIFYRHLLSAGIAAERIVLEEEAGNFAENIANARKLVPDTRSAIFVTKPNSVKRVLLTVPMQWPGIRYHVSAPAFAYPQHVSQTIGQLGVLDEMVGDVHRLFVYPQKGFMQPDTVPPDVQKAWMTLIGRGFDRHLLPGEALSTLAIGCHGQ